MRMTNPTKRKPSELSQNYRPAKARMGEKTGINTTGNRRQQFRKNDRDIDTGTPVRSDGDLVDSEQSLGYPPSSLTIR